MGMQLAMASEHPVPKDVAFVTPQWLSGTEPAQLGLSVHSANAEVQVEMKMVFDPIPPQGIANRRRAGSSLN